MITIDDFDLTPDEMKYLVTGAQKYLAPPPDPLDDQPLLAAPTTPKETQP